MSETIVCFWNTMKCTEEQCPAYHDASLQCMWGMWLNRQLGDIDGSMKKEPELDPQSTEGVTQRILTTYPNLTKEAVERLIDEERAKAAGLLTEQAAAHLVASNLGQGQQTPVVESMRPSGLPDISQIKWMIKGNVDARDTDAFAYAFVFKYDADAKKATDELRFESAELYNYLKENNNTLTLDGFTYSLNREGSLFGRNKAKT